MSEAAGLPVVVDAASYRVMPREARVEWLLGEMSRGRKVREVAESVGLHEVSILSYMLDHCPAEWAKLSAGRALARLEEAEEVLDRAEETVDVSRATRMSQNAQWTLERMAPRLYAGKQEGGGVAIVVNIDPSCGGSVVIEGGGVSAAVGGSGAEASGENSGGEG